MTAKNPIMVAPPIYNFYFPSNPKESSWGWQHSGDLLIAVNNIRERQGKEPARSEDILKLYPSLKPVISEGGWIAAASTMVSHKGSIAHIVAREGDNWFFSAFSLEYYLPAKVGMQLLELVKKDVRAYRHATER